MSTTDHATPEPPFATSPVGPERAAELLAAPEALTQLTIEHARAVVQYMRPRFIPSGTVFIREGEAAGDSGFMALLIEGEVLVERLTVSAVEPSTVRVLGPGSLVGELALVDHSPRSATCTASTDVWCAIVTRQAVETMIEQEPAVAARFLLGVSAHIAERLRDTSRKVKLYARLASTMREELELMMKRAERRTPPPETPPI